MSKRGRIDWSAVERDYIHGTIKVAGKTKRHSISTLAEQYGCSQSMVERKSAELGWVEKRKEYMREIDEEVMDRKKTQLVDRAVQFDSKVFNNADIICDLLTEKLTMKAKDGTILLNPAVTILEAQRIASVLVSIQQVREKVIGQASSSEESSLNELNDILKDLQEAAA